MYQLIVIAIMIALGINVSENNVRTMKINLIVSEILNVFLREVACKLEILVKLARI